MTLNTRLTKFLTVPKTICLGFLAVISVGALLLMLPIATTTGTWGNPITALFTSTSAVCVTGLAVVDTGTYFSFWGQAFLTLLIQVGGLGYMSATTFLLLLLGKKLGLKDRVALQRALDTADLSKVLYVLRSIILLTLIFELTGVFLLFPTFLKSHGWNYGLWLAVFHSVSAFNNAGFSLFPNNLMDYVANPTVSLVIAGLIICGGLGYEVLMELFLGLRDRLSKRNESIVYSLHFKLVTSTTLILLVTGTLAFLATEYHNPATLGSLSPNTQLLAAWFQSVTTRTAGFNTIDIGKMGTASLFITIALMFIGASPGGTGGGIKTTTVRALFACTRAVLVGKETVMIYRRQLPISLIFKAISVVVGSTLVVIGFTVLGAIADPNLEFIDLFFETVSAFGTVGLSTGITPKLSTLNQLLIIGVMYIGRVGVLLLMGAIIGEPKPSSIRYPEEDFLVG